MIPFASGLLYQEDTVVVVSATCQFGFISWVGTVPAGVDLAQRFITLVMNRDRSVIAVCAAPAPTVTPSPTVSATPTATPTPVPTPTPTPSQGVGVEIGEWIAASALNLGTDANGYTIWNGRLYVVRRTSYEVGTLDQTGNVTWQSFSPGAGPCLDSDGWPAVAANGFIYISGGFQSGTFDTALNTVCFPQILSNGTLGPWTQTSSL